MTTIVTTPPDSNLPVSSGVKVADTVADPPPTTVRTSPDTDTTVGSDDAYTNDPDTFADGSVTANGESPKVLDTSDHVNVGVAFEITNDCSTVDADSKNVSPA